MWTTARGVLVGEDLQPGCANTIHQHYVAWWRRHSQGRGGAYFAEELPTSGAHFTVEQLWVSRLEMAVRRVSWARAADDHWDLTGEEIVRPGPKRFAWRPQRDRDRFMQVTQETLTEESAQEHAWRGHGEGAMALLRPSWLMHGRRVVKEWEDEIDGVPVVRRRTDRIVPLESRDMLGHALNPLLMDMSEQIVFSYDPERDVIREWYDLWDGEPCTTFQIRDLVFDEHDGIGEPYVVRRIA